MGEIVLLKRIERNMHIIQLFIKSLKPRRKSLGLTKLRTMLKIYYGVCGIVLKENNAKGNSKFFLNP
jgi:hypothetical protein